MPTFPRKGVRTIYAHVPPALYDELAERARLARRTLRAELVIALEQYLGVETEPPRKVGRPKNT